MNSAGRIGLNRSDPLSRLHVASDNLKTGSSVSRRWASISQSIILQTREHVNICATFETSIWIKSSLVMTSSDSKIKKNIEDLDDEECLNKLLLLKSCKYEYVDIFRNEEDIKNVWLHSSRSK